MSYAQFYKPPGQGGQSPFGTPGGGGGGQYRPPSFGGGIGGTVGGMGGKHQYSPVPDANAAPLSNPWDNMGDETRKKYDIWKGNQPKDQWTGETSGSEQDYWNFLNPVQNVTLGPGGGGYQPPIAGTPTKRAAQYGGTPASGQKVLKPRKKQNYVPYIR